MNGLAPHTEKIFESISKLECIKPYVLVGGTALSLQIDTRLSEDLDFMSWRTSRSERREVNWPFIKKELETVGRIESMDILDIDHVEFIVNGVKISFYANPNYAPFREPIHFLNNLRLADSTSIGAMKMEVMMRRSKFRDYYDIYSIMKSGVSLEEMIELALKYSRHRMKSKNLLAMLTRSDRFEMDSHFQSLSPKYNITADGIEKYISLELSKQKSSTCSLDRLD